MTDPQGWTLIGVFAAVMLGALTISSTLLSRVITTSVGSVKEIMAAKFEALETRFDAKLAASEQRIVARIELLDRDVAAVSRKVFGTPED